jgi:type I restriction enzyme S subunit
MKLEEACEFIIDAEHKTAPFLKEGYPNIRTPNIGKGRLILEGVFRVSEETYRGWTKRAVPQPNDLILAREAPVGNVAIIPENELVCLGQRTVLLRPDTHKTDPHFLCYFLLSDKMQNLMLGKSGGATVAHLNMKDIRALELGELPPLPTQQKIASILSAYDDLIENNLKRIRLLEEAAQHLYREWFVRFRFPATADKPGWEEVEVVDGLPEGWARKTLGEMCHLNMGQSPSSDFYNEHGEGLPFHQGVTNYGHRFVSHKTYCTNETRIAEEGDILCSVRAPVGRLNVTLDKIVIGRGLSAMRNKDNLQSFQFYQLKNHFVQEDMIGGGTIFSSVTKKELENQVFVCPTKELMEEFERVCKPMDEQIRNLHLQNQKLKEARDILLPRLMNQTIEV